MRSAGKAWVSRVFRHHPFGSLAIIIGEVRPVFSATFLGLALAFVSPPPPAIAAQGDFCADVLKYAARNETVESYEDAIATSTYDNYCEGESLKEGANLNVGVEAVIKAVPAKFNLGYGSTSDRVKHFCKTFASEYAARSAHYKMQSIVVLDAVAAWKSCIALSREGIEFKPQVTPTTLVVDVRRTLATPAAVIGIRYDSGLLTCEIEGADGLRPASELKKQALKETYWPIVCKRIGKDEGGVQVFPRTDMVVATTAGSFTMPVPREEKLSESLATNIRAQLDELGMQVKAVREASPGIECKRTSQAVPVGRPPIASVKIPDADKGKYVVTGGGCSVPGGHAAYGHNPPIYKSYPEEEGGIVVGWTCYSGDPPNIPLPHALEAWIVYCRTRLN